MLLLRTLRINLLEQSNRFRNADHRLGITAEMMRKLNINKVSSISRQPANNGPRSIVSIWFAGNNGEESLIIQLFPTHYPRMRARILWFSGQESRDFGRRSLTGRHLLCRGLVVLILRLSLDPHLEGEELRLLSPNWQILLHQAVNHRCLFFFRASFAVHHGSQGGDCFPSLSANNGTESNTITRSR